MLTAPAGRPTLSVYVTPHPPTDIGPMQALCTQIDDAKSSIEFAIFAFTSVPISAALQNARARGVKITGVADDNQWDNPGSQLPILANLGFDIVRATNQHALMHTKAAVIDDHVVAWGSFNWTKAASFSNDELMTVATGSPLLVAYMKADIARMRSTASLSR